MFVSLFSLSALTRWVCDGGADDDVSVHPRWQSAVLVLLDLIGVANVKFSSFWASTGASSMMILSSSSLHLTYKQMNRHILLRLADPYYSRLRAIETSLKNTLNG